MGHLLNRYRQLSGVVAAFGLWTILKVCAAHMGCRFWWLLRRHMAGLYTMGWLVWLMWLALGMPQPVEIVTPEPWASRVASFVM